MSISPQMAETLDSPVANPQMKSLGSALYGVEDMIVVRNGVDFAVSSLLKLLLLKASNLPISFTFLIECAPKILLLLMEP